VAGSESSAEHANPAIWRAVLDLLRVERLALAGTTPVDNGHPGAPVEQAHEERERRLSALRGALTRLDSTVHGGLGEKDRVALRELITDRVNSLTALDGAALYLPDTDESASGGIWRAVGDVLATERHALTALAPRLSAETSARLERDDTIEHAALAIGTA